VGRYELQKHPGILIPGKTSNFRLTPENYFKGVKRHDDVTAGGNFFGKDYFEDPLSLKI